MDPFSLAGLALGVASLGAQVFSGCMIGIQLLITAKGYNEDCRYLNLRLRMEQQRLFAWSETSGLLDMDTDRINKSNTFILHRTTVIDLLLQIQVLFDKFRETQIKHKGLAVDREDDSPGRSAGSAASDPEKEAQQANVPLRPRHRDFLKRLLLREKTDQGVQRLKWLAFDKSCFEDLIRRFSTLNDNMTDILDAKMQAEIHHVVNDTNRGVLQLHHQVADLQRLVLALNVKLDSGASSSGPSAVIEGQGMQLGSGTGMGMENPFVQLVGGLEKAAGGIRAGGDSHAPPSYQQATISPSSPFELLRQLAQFKAFNSIIEPRSSSPSSASDYSRSNNPGDPADQPQLSRLERDANEKFSQQQQQQSSKKQQNLSPSLLHDLNLPITLANPDFASSTPLQLSRNSFSHHGDGITPSSALSNARTGASRTEATYSYIDPSTGAKREERVWIEWRAYQPPPPTHGGLLPPSQEAGDGGSKRITIDRVRKLAALLNHSKPAEFRTAHCLGWFDRAASIPVPGLPSSPGGQAETDDEEDEDILNMKLALVFSLPAGSSLSHPPVSLRDLFLDASPSGQKRSWPLPTLSDRIRLAHAIASSLLYLHSVCWLHKGLRSHNIIFFPVTEEKEVKINYTTPTLSGFDFSRPEHRSDMTEAPSSSEEAECNLYRHPLAQSVPDKTPQSPTTTYSMSNPQHTTNNGKRPPYRRTFDIFSLGVLLVELSHWSPIHTILSLPSLPQNPRITLTVRTRILSPPFLQDIAFRMGSSYADAVRRCILGGEGLGIPEGGDERDDGVIATMGVVFYEEVVKTLGDIWV